VLINEAVAAYELESAFAAYEAVKAYELESAFNAYEAVATLVKVIGNVVPSPLVKVIVSLTAEAVTTALSTWDAVIAKEAVPYNEPVIS
jgi:hypothetical protein